MFFLHKKVFIRFLTVAYIGVLVCFPPAAAFAQNTPPPNTGFVSLAGSERGLYGIPLVGAPKLLWNGGEVVKIARAGNDWLILTDLGILVSGDLYHWEARNNGLPVKTIKVFENGERSFVRMIQGLKDVKIHPENPDIMVTATKDAVFLSRDSGRGWKNIGMPPYQANGLKSVAVGNMPELTVFVSHSIYGVYYFHPDKPGMGWRELSQGLEKMESTGNPDEVSDIKISLEKNAQGEQRHVVYAGQTFRHRLYQLDWEKKSFNLIWSLDTAFGTIDSIDTGRDAIRFVKEGAVLEKQFSSGLTRARVDLFESIQKASGTLGFPFRCFAFLNGGEIISLSELWLLNLPEAEDKGRAAGREGLYLPVNHAMDAKSLKPYLDIIKERNLNMAVIDMKDDYGRLRFIPGNTSLKEKGRVFWPVDIDALVRTMKERGIYLVARIVVFKDPELAKKENGKYAVWDSKTGQPWAGYYETRREKTEGDGSPAGTSNLVQEIRRSDDPDFEIVRTFYDERWVDPYSEEVWQYNSDVAKELIERGFDEIQFDYIRFPTDGINLPQAQYRWKDSGMDMESAMLSFLRHARSTIKAPISIDIYGANGWYRTGARTGQEVEMLAPYVDVICPMYYPSHFEQDFLAQDPPEERPYRIYFQGTLRTERIARGRIIVRPYAQAFYLNVSYDRNHYNKDYVLRELKGVRDAGAPGLTYWNNSGRYEDIPVH